MENFRRSELNPRGYKLEAKQNKPLGYLILRLVFLQINMNDQIYPINDQTPTEGAHTPSRVIKPTSSTLKHPNE